MVDCILCGRATMNMLRVQYIGPGGWVSVYCLPMKGERDGGHKNAFSVMNETVRMSDGNLRSHFNILKGNLPEDLVLPNPALISKQEVV